MDALSSFSNLFQGKQKQLINNLHDLYVVSLAVREGHSESYRESKEANAVADAAAKAENLTNASNGHLFSAHLLKEGLNLGVNTTVQTVAEGRFDDLIKAGGLMALANAVGAVTSNNIGDAHYKNEVNAFSHKALHALSGSVQGLIIKGEKGIAPAVLGTLVAETVADVMTPTGGLGALPKDQRPVYSQDQIQLTQDVARLTAATAALLAGMDEAGIAIAIATATTAVENNFARSAERAAASAGSGEGEEVEADEGDGYDTDEEAMASDVGKLREVYTDPLKEAAKSTGLDKLSEVSGEYAEVVASGEKGYVAAKLLEAETLSGRKLTGSERTLLSESFAESYHDDVSAVHMMEGIGLTTTVPGKTVEWFLRNTGLTDKGTARAVGWVVNDALAAVGVGAMAKGALKKGTVKGVKSGLRKVKAPAAPELSNYEKIISQIPGHVSSHATAMAPGPLPAKWQETFSGGRYAVITLDKPLEISRA